MRFLKYNLRLLLYLSSSLIYPRKPSHIHVVIILSKGLPAFIFPNEDAENDFLSGLKHSFEDSGKFSHIENIMGFGRCG